MCQNETPFRSIEESSETFSGVPAGLASRPEDEIATVAVEPKGSLSEAGGLLDGLSSDQLLAVLGSIGLLTIVAAWFFDGVYQRIEFEMYRLKHWWRCKKEDLHSRFEVPFIVPKLGLSPASNTDQSDSSASTSDVAILEAVDLTDSLSGQAEFRHQVLAEELPGARAAEHQARSELADTKEQLKLLNQAETKELALKDSHRETLEVSLANHVTQIEMLQASISETSSNADQMAASLEDSNLRCQELTDELVALTSFDEKSRSELADARVEIEALTLQATRFENDSQAATREAIDKTDLADRLLEENTWLKSSLEKLEDQFAGADAEAKDLSKSQENIQARLREEIDNRARAAKKFDSEIADRESQLVASQEEVFSLKSEIAELTDHVTQIEKLEASLSETSSNADQMAASLKDSNLRCQELADELTASTCVDEKSRSELADARVEIEALTLQAIRFEKDSQIVIQAALDKAILADRLLEENTCLKSSLEKTEDQFAGVDAEIKALSKSKEGIQARLQEEIDNRARAANKFESEIAERESQLVASQEEVSRLESEIAALAEGGQLKLAEALNKLSCERTLHNQLKQVVQRNRDELSLQASKFLEQESKLESLIECAEKSEHELAATVELLESERLCLVEITEKAQKREEEMSELVSRNSELQSRLEISQQRAEQAERESGETLETLKNEQELRAEAFRKLEASEKRVGELEHEADAPTVAVADYHRLVSKLIKYKNAYQKIKALGDELVVQKLEMSDLASEYLAMAKTIRHELDEERQTSRGLKMKLDQASASDFDSNEAELKGLVDQRARDHVLHLKSQFEQKLKQKNELIREIQKRQVVESSIR